MAPEMLLGKADMEVDEKCDMWAIGIIAYILVCQEMPFKLGGEKGGRDAIKQFQQDIQNYK